MLRINKVAVRDPYDLSVDLSDIDASAERTADGSVVRDRIATKYKLNMSWNALTVQEMATLLTAVQDEFFEAEFIDPKTGSYVVKTMYVGDRSAPIAFVREDDGAIMWKGLTMNFVER